MALVLLCTATASASASAAEPDPTAEAKELFLQARAAVKKGDPAQALALFRKSQGRRPTAGTLYNIAICEEQLGLTASAYQHFKELATQLSASDERLPVTKEHVAILEPRVPWLRIDLARGAPTGTSVTRDDVEVSEANLGVELPVDPGTYELVVTAPGRSVRRYTVTAAEGKHETRTVEPGEQTASMIKAAAPPPHLLAKAPVQEAPRRASGSTVAVISLGTAGFTGIGAGAGFGVAAIVKKNQVEKLCPVPKQCTAAGVAVEGTSRVYAAASTVAFAVGLSALGIGTVLVLTNRDRPTTKAAIAPLVLPGGAGLATSGAF